MNPSLKLPSAHLILLCNPGSEALSIDVYHQLANNTTHPRGTIYSEEGRSLVPPLTDLDQSRKAIGSHPVARKKLLRKTVLSMPQGRVKREQTRTGTRRANLSLVTHTRSSVTTRGPCILLPQACRRGDPSRRNPNRDQELRDPNRGESERS